MLRFLCHILGIKYETCLGCLYLKEQTAAERLSMHDQLTILLEQLRVEREENKRLNDAIIELVKPKQVEKPHEYIPTEPFSRPSLFSRRKAEMERISRETARTMETSNNLGKPDVEVPKVTEERKVYGQQQSIEELERELGVEEVNG